MTAPDSKNDAKVYALARSYLLTFASYGVTEELLAYYLTPKPTQLRPADLPSVYEHLLESAQNRGMMNTVVSGAIGGIGALRPVLCDFDPGAVARLFASPEALLDTVVENLEIRGKVRRNTGSLWPVFARAALSGARFLAQFRDLADFLGWVAIFDDDPRKRAALPLVISREVDGFGFALACDFLKELGYLNFAKPDVHVKAIVGELGLCSAKADDYAVFKAVVRIAENCHRTPYDVDKALWLVGSGRFYDHRDMGTHGRIPTDRDAFIASARRALGIGA
jgi:hypothetical protein